MMKPKMNSRWIKSRWVRSSGNAFVNNLLKGAIILAPVAITVGAFMWAFTLVDDILPGILQFFLNILFPSQNVKAPHIFGLGFIVFILLVTLVGYISSFFLFSRLMHLLDLQLTKTPGVKVIYTTIKDLIKTLQQNNKQFDKPVMFSLDEREQIWRIGFVASESMAQFQLPSDKLAIYVPMSFSMAGEVYLVSRARVRELEGVAAADAMKFVLSGGFVHKQDESKGAKDTHKSALKDGVSLKDGAGD